jgi:glucose/arabinose dehydrogenase
MRALLGALALVLLVPAAPVGAAEDGVRFGPDVPPTVAGPAARAAAPMPTLDARRVVTGLENPWDVKPIGGGRLLITERDTADLLLHEGGETRQVTFPSAQVWVEGETGLMSLEIDPQFADTGRFYTCHGGTRPDGGHDVRVVAWRLNDDATRARKVENLLTGLPASSGRHGGCRLLILRSGALLVGTGDAAVGTNPRNLKSLGGKTLRLNRKTGAPWGDNRWADAQNRRKRYVFTYGHRNVQGLAQRRNGSLWSVEHGSWRDDEVNLLRRGSDYGWHPVPGYNETVPMTDFSLPGKQRGAKWRSGSTTKATSGAAWVRGSEWGRLNGTLAVAALKSSRVIFMKFGSQGKLQWTKAPAALREFGRLRSVTAMPGGDLLVTSDNDSGDAIIRVSPVE